MGADYQSWVERQIQDAQARGEFDNLPGAGKPLRSLDTPPSENWWVEGLIERENLDMSAALPPQLALRKEGQALSKRIMDERSETVVREILEDFNARVRECWRRPMDGPLAVVRTVDVEELVGQWREREEARRAAQSARATAGPDEATPPRSWPPRSWLNRAVDRLRPTWRRSGE